MFRSRLSRFIAINRRSILLLGTLLCLAMFGVIAWRTDARDRSEAKRERTNNRLRLDGDMVESEGDEDGDIDDDARDYPPDTTSYWRPAIPADHIRLRKAPATVTATVVDLVVNNANTGLAGSDTFGDSETNIAIDPSNTNKIVITAFSGGWGATAPFWYTTNGGANWIKFSTFNSPPGATGVTGCPCDQSVDYGRGSLMSATVLTSTPTNVFSGITADPSNFSGFNYFTVAGVAQRTNAVASGNTDQPWLLVNRDPTNANQDNTYVAYDDFTISPRGMRVAVASGTNPPNFDRDNLAGFGPTGTINPGQRLAVDPRNGTVYTLFQQLVQTNVDGSRKVNFMLNRSTDAGVTWALNGSSTGINVATADSTQPTPKFGTVNALLGGVLHATVDPTNGDVYYVYGNRDSATGNNRLSIRRLTSDGNGGLLVGPPFFVNGQVQSALPSVAINSAGVVGVFYYTFDGFSNTFPIFTAHFATSLDHGQTFPTDTVLETFLSSALDNSDARQRVLGDYHQVKAVGDTFYGSFTGNGVPFGRTISNHDPIFYKLTVSAPVSISGRVFTSNGVTGLRNATVSLTDSAGGVRTTTTSSFGFYSFDNIATGSAYTLRIGSRLYRFQPLVVTPSSELTGIDFVGLE